MAVQGINFSDVGDTHIPTANLRSGNVEPGMVDTK